MEHPPRKESDGPLKDALDSLKEADGPVYVLPRDIDRLCPRIGEVAYVDAFGDWHYKPMPIASITTHYVTFRDGSPRTSVGWLEFKVCRRRTGLGFTFVLSRGWAGALYCRLHKVEKSFD